MHTCGYVHACNTDNNIQDTTKHCQTEPVGHRSLWLDKSLHTSMCSKPTHTVDTNKGPQNARGQTMYTQHMDTVTMAE